METVKTLLDELSRLYERMDGAYRQFTVQTGFICQGCEDNCCQTRFHHHTLAELVYLRTGLAQLPDARQRKIRERADKAEHEATRCQVEGMPLWIMCPLNEKDKCVLYEYRPMICRMHGVPHELHRPDGVRQVGPGCDEFYNQCGTPDGLRMDRTPYYRDMAQLEGRLRRQTGYGQKIKLTVAQMIIEKGKNIPGLG